MIDAKCSTKTKASKIKVVEKGKQAVFLNPNKSEFVKVQMDGCVRVNETSCDWLIIHQKVDVILIELKGTDVDHALFQIEATFQYLKENGLLGARNAALIVCSRPSRHPSFTSKLQKTKSRLSDLYRAPLHVVTGSHEYHVDKVLSHSGPLGG